jgi:hypothetical protein
METKIKKRYNQKDEREFQIYSDEFDRLLTSSDILEGDQHPSIHSNFYDRQGLLQALAQLVGVNNSDSYKDRSGHTILAYIPYCKQQLAELDMQHNEFNERRLSAGYKKSDEWPPNLLKERLKLEAKCDIYLREEEAIRQAINNLKQEVDNEQDKHCLEFGPQGNGRLRGGDLVELDGQRIERIKGKLIITSKSHPIMVLLFLNIEKKSASHG